MPKQIASRKIAVALHAGPAPGDVALCAAVGMPESGVPEWIHLLPAGEIRTVDGRGPYSLGDATSLIAASLHQGDRLVIDENHATDLAAPKGEPAPARGWIVGLEARADGVWGQVEWTEAGKALVGDRAYRAISPVIAHGPDNRIKAILRASLVNRPNLRGLATLHQTETDMTLLQRLLKALGFEDSTSEDALVAAVTGLHQANVDTKAALQAQLAPIAKAAGLADNATAEAIIGAVAAKTGGDGATIEGLQQELATTATALNTLKTQIATDRATAFVDDAIKAGKVGVRPLRDHYIAMHAQDPARVEKEIGALPALGPSGALAVPPSRKDGKVELTPEQRQAVALMGVSEEAYRKTLEVEAAAETAL